MENNVTATVDNRRNDEIRGMVADPRTGFVGVPDGVVGAGAVGILQE